MSVPTVSSNLILLVLHLLMFQQYYNYAKLELSIIKISGSPFNFLNSMMGNGFVSNFGRDSSVILSLHQRSSSSKWTWLADKHLHSWISKQPSPEILWCERVLSTDYHHLSLATANPPRLFAEQSKQASKSAKSCFILAHFPSVCCYLS